MASKFENIATALVVVSAVAIASTFVYRELGGRSIARTPPTLSPPTFVSDWKELLDVGVPSHEAERPVTIIEFSDLECPFCRRFHRELIEVLRANPATVRAVFVHYPLPQHRFAIPAARAAECSRTFSRFAHFVDEVFEKQDSLGLKSWTSYAADAGISDTIAFSKCAGGTEVPAAVTAGLSSGGKLKLEGTPTVIINGWRFSVPPYDSLAKVVERMRRGDYPPA